MRVLIPYRKETMLAVTKYSEITKEINLWVQSVECKMAVKTTIYATHFTQLNKGKIKSILAKNIIIEWVNHIRSQLGTDTRFEKWLNKDKIETNTNETKDNISSMRMDPKVFCDNFGIDSENDSTDAELSSA